MCHDATCTLAVCEYACLVVIRECLVDSCFLFQLLYVEFVNLRVHMIIMTMTMMTTTMMVMMVMMMMTKPITTAMLMIMVMIMVVMIILVIIIIIVIVIVIIVILIIVTVIVIVILATMYQSPPLASIQIVASELLCHIPKVRLSVVMCVVLLWSYILCDKLRLFLAKSLKTTIVIQRRLEVLNVVKFWRYV